MGTRRIGDSWVSGSQSGRYAKSMVELSFTVLRLRLVLKWRAGVLLGVVLFGTGRFESWIAVLKAREPPTLS